MPQKHTRFIRFVMSGRKEFTVDEYQAMEILSSPQQLIPIKTMGGDWTGETVNKAHIVCTERDRDAEKEFESKRWRIEQRKLYLESLKEIKPEKLEDYKAEVKKNKEQYDEIVKYLTSKMSLKIT